MEGQDPRGAARNPQEGKLKNIMYAMIAVAVILAAALAYIWWRVSP